MTFLLLISLLLSLTMINGKVFHHCQNISEASNNLAFGIYKTLPSEGNVFFSPLSILTTLGMAGVGARDKTQEEIYGLLGLCENNNTVFPTKKSLNYPNYFNSTLKVANVAIAQKCHAFLPEFKRILEHKFGALVKKVDSECTIKEILNEVNEFVAKKTNGKIVRFIENIDRETKLILANAVYFNHSWETCFNEKHTERRIFWNNNKYFQGAPVETMNRFSYFDYMEDHRFTAVQIPYKDSDLKMLVVMPHRFLGSDKLKQLTNETFLEIIRSLRNEKVNLFLPKWNITYSTDLKNSLVELGMKLAFKKEGDFSGVTGYKDLHLSHLVHKSAIEVNEKGSEAVEEELAFYARGEPDSTKIIRVNRPFLFYIYDSRNNMIHFSGRINVLQSQ